MVLGLHGPGRVGRRRFISTSRLRAARFVCRVPGTDSLAGVGASSPASSVGGAGRARRPGGYGSPRHRRGSVDFPRHMRVFRRHPCGPGSILPPIWRFSSEPRLAPGFGRLSTHTCGLRPDPGRGLTGSGIRSRMRPHCLTSRCSSPPPERTRPLTSRSSPPAIARRSPRPRIRAGSVPRGGCGTVAEGPAPARPRRRRVRRRRARVAGGSGAGDRVPEGPGRRRIRVAEDPGRRRARRPGHAAGRPPPERLSGRPGDGRPEGMDAVGALRPRPACPSSHGAGAGGAELRLCPPGDGPA